MSSGRPLLLASRTRKARRVTCCCLCGSPVRVGERIGLLLTGWAHVLCIVNRNTCTEGEQQP